MGSEAMLPPSARPARLLALVWPFMPVLLPVAIYFHRRARLEATSDSRYRWPQRWIDRPLLFGLIIWAGFLGLVFLLIVIPAALGMNIA